jgi:hypothetical protein
MVKRIQTVLAEEGHLQALRVLADQLAQQIDANTDPDLGLSLTRAFINVSRAITTAERAELARRMQAEHEASINSTDSVEHFLAEVSDAAG